MSKILTLSLILVSVVTIAWAPVSAGDACKRTKFETKLVSDACTAGGTAKAKDVMKKWVKDTKSKQSNLECATCHSKMAPSYDLKPDAVGTFKKLGGQ